MRARHRNLSSEGRLPSAAPVVISQPMVGPHFLTKLHAILLSHTIPETWRPRWRSSDGVRGTKVDPSPFIDHRETPGGEVKALPIGARDRLALGCRMIRLGRHSHSYRLPPPRARAAAACRGGPARKSRVDDVWQAPARTGARCGTPLRRAPPGRSRSSSKTRAHDQQAAGQTKWHRPREPGRIGRIASPLSSAKTVMQRSMRWSADPRWMRHSFVPLAQRPHHGLGILRQVASRRTKRVGEAEALKFLHAADHGGARISVRSASTPGRRSTIPSCWSGLSREDAVEIVQRSTST